MIYKMTYFRQKDLFGWNSVSLTLNVKTSKVLALFRLCNMNLFSKMIHSYNMLKYFPSNKLVNGNRSIAGKLATELRIISLK